LAKLVKRLSAHTRRRARLLVNDRVDVAIAAGADGVHLKGDGPPAMRVREIVPEGWLIGRSIHSVGEARRTGGEDFLFFGTVFTSRSKAGSPVAGTDALADAAVVASVPLLAIGGVTAARAAACRDSGAAGVAAIELFLPIGRTPAAMGPAAAVSALRNAWRG
jgi:thiamine-phosphate pyrophosphorylase